MHGRVPSQPKLRLLRGGMRLTQARKSTNSYLAAERRSPLSLSRWMAAKCSRDQVASHDVMCVSHANPAGWFRTSRKGETIKHNYKSSKILRVSTICTNNRT